MSNSGFDLSLKRGAHIHLMGICGTAMASLAGLLLDRGYKITGSDLNPYPPMSTQLESLGITIMKGYSAENLSIRPDFIIVGNVISASNAEAQEMVRLGIPHTSLPKAMGDSIIGSRESIVISGTHGKTTTTSMMAWVAQCLELQPGFLIGGIAKNFSKSFQNPEGKYFIIEGDEYDTAFFDKVPKFIHYKPRHVVLTSIEFDHADIYKDLQAVKDAFSRLVKLVPAEGTLVYWGDDKNIQELMPSCQAKKCYSYSLIAGDYLAKVVSVSERETRFTVSFQGLSLGEYSMILTGDYNVLNATSVVAIAHQQGWDMRKVQKALQEFSGVKRRQEVLGEPNGVLVIEDFAHHPTAVKETVKGILQKYSGRKLFAVFEPRSATSRRKVFQKQYVEAFLDCPEILISEAFDQGKITETDRFSSKELVQDLQHAGKSAKVYSTVDRIVSDLKSVTQPGDLVLIMSNGGFDGIYAKLLQALEPV